MDGKYNLKILQLTHIWAIFMKTCKDGHSIFKSIFWTAGIGSLTDIRNGTNTVVQDRTIYEDAHIFAPNLHDMQLMTSRDFANYIELFRLMSSQVEPPDLLIYLRSGISKPSWLHIYVPRGRDYKGDLSLDYLKKLNERYEKWISGYTFGQSLSQ